ncbi:unnamed protein product, partial [Prorocentrum cordatum]
TTATSTIPTIANTYCHPHPASKDAPRWGGPQGGARDAPSRAPRALAGGAPARRPPGPPRGIHGQPWPPPASGHGRRGLGPDRVHFDPIGQMSDVSDAERTGSIARTHARVGCLPEVARRHPRCQCSVPCWRPGRATAYGRHVIVRKTGCFSSF